MKVLVTVAFWFLFILTLPFGVAFGVLLWLLTTPFDRHRRLIHTYNCRWCFTFLRLIPSWDIRIEDREHIPSGPCVLVANHQSMADVVVLMGLFRQFKFVSKQSLFAIPMVGWMMTLARYVNLVRGRPHSTQEMLDACRAWIRQGIPVLIFPEGTYSPDDHLLPFKRGAFRLAIDERVPLVLVHIAGSRSLVIEDGPWLNPSCHVRVQVHPAWPAHTLGTSEAELAERARTFFAECVGRQTG